MATNRPILLHSCYAAATIFMFAWGSHWARPASDDLAEPDGGNGWSAPQSRTAQIPAALTATRPSRPQGRPDRSLVASGADGIIGAWGFAGLPSEWASLTRSLDSAPLSEEQITELVLLAIQSRNPVERRKAFDRILAEMGSESFSTEQAFAIRSVMHDNGASGEQWRLFDYAWGANDPAAAVAYLDEIPEQYRNGYMSNMIPGLASSTPRVAMDLVAELEPGDLKRNISGRLIEGLVDANPAMATDYVRRLAEAGDPDAR